MSTIAETLAEAGRLFDAERLEEAEQLYRKILRQEPTNDGLMRQIGVVTRKLLRFAESEAILRQAIAQSPNKAFNHFELGITLVRQDRKAEALPHFIRAVELEPQFQQAYINVGACYEHLERYDDALPWCQRAVELSPHCAISIYNLGNVLREQGDIAAAQHCFEEAIRLDPENAKAHWNMAFCHLVRGQFAKGWPEYEWRQAAGEVTIDGYTQPRWKGESLAGKTLLVHAEQGIGDEILFASCFGDVIAQAKKVIIVCEPRLVALFERSFPTTQVLGWQRRKDWAPPAIDENIDFQIPAGSVPLYLRNSSDSFPNRKSFLTADQARRAAWAKKLRQLGPGKKIGISWQAGGQPAERRRRTTDLALWRAVLQTRGVHFVNLQYGELDSQYEAVQRELGVSIAHFSECDPLVDLDDFAALVAELDLVISVGNATVHLAGALGTPAWALLPLIPAWRWMSEGDRNPWYSSVLLLRQRVRGQWEPLFERVASMLNEMSNPQPLRTGRRGVGLDRQGKVIIVGAGAIASSAIPQPAVPAANPSAEPASIRNAAPIQKSTANPITTLPTAVPVTELGSFSRTSGIHDAFDRAVQHFNAGELGPAESLCREILEHTPRHTNASHMLGIVARQTGRFDLAVRSFRRAIAVSPRDAQLHTNLADALKDLAQVDESVASYRTALEIKPDFIEARLNLGNVLLKYQRYAEAEIEYQEAVRQRPDFAKAYNALGACHLEQQRPDRAEVELRRAVALDARYFAAMNNLGRALQNQNKSAEARISYEQALAIEPRCIQALINLAGLLEGIQQPAQALPFYRRALDLQPANAEVKTAIARIEAAPRTAAAAPSAPRPAAGLRITPSPHYLPDRVPTSATVYVRQGLLKQ